MDRLLREAGHAVALDGESFASYQRRLMAHAEPETSAGLEVALIEIASLLDGTVIEYKHGTKTGDPQCLLRIRCRRVSPRVTGEAVMAELERAWTQDISVGAEAHTLTETDRSVVMEFVCGPGAEGGSYVTGVVTVDLDDMRSPRRGKHRSARAR